MDKTRYLRLVKPGEEKVKKVKDGFYYLDMYAQLFSSAVTTDSLEGSQMLIFLKEFLSFVELANNDETLNANIEYLVKLNEMKLKWFMD